MPNNIVFNDVANQLKTAIYGTDGTNQVQISVNSEGAVIIATSDPISVTGTVTVTANDFDIRGLTAASDTVTVTANDFDIRGLTAASDTVTVTANDFDIRGLTAASDTVTVTANDFDIRGLTAASDTVTVTATDFEIRQLTAASDAITSFMNVASSTVDAPATQTGTILQMDTSDKSMYSYYIKNNDTTSLTVNIQISPTTTDGYFVNDSSEPVVIGNGESTVLVPKQYLNYTRLYYEAASAAPSFEAYYNAQG